MNRIAPWIVAVLLPLCAAGAEAPAEGSATFAWLRPPLPGQPASCPDAVVAGDLLKVPLFADRSVSCPVAEAGGEVVTLGDLTESLASAHEGHGGATRAAGQDFRPILDRLIDSRLIVLEARTMGIPELPETAKQVDMLEANVARDMVKRRAIADARPDPAQVDRLYKQAVQEVKVRSVLLTSEADAKAMSAAIKGGARFDAEARRMVAAKKARGGEAGDFVRPDKLLPQVAAAVGKLKVGGTTPPVKLAEGWTVVHLEDVRHPADEKARAEATQRSLKAQQAKALKTYYEGLVKRYAKIDRKLLRSLDYEAAKPGFPALAKDTRVLARVEGQPSITVGEFSATLGGQFYHGVENAIKEKKINRQKLETLDVMLSPRLIAAEAARLKIADTPEYKAEVASTTSQLLFGTFVEKVVVPDVKLKDAEVKSYYDEHRADFSYPAFVKLQSIGFRTAKDAQAAVDKLRAGTDFKWLNANADGKLREGEKSEAPPGGTVAVNRLPAALAKAVENSKAGDFRYYAAADGQHYAVQVLEQVPAQVQPFDEAKGAIAKKLYAEALGKAIKDWAAKLRKAYPVQVYLARIGS